MAIMLILGGMVLAIAGLILLLAGKFPWLGHLPGDMNLRGRNWSFSFPLATSAIASIVVTIVLNILFRLMRK